jgi:glycosyltransferase involved in cell wall biosynthesis
MNSPLVSVLIPTYNSALYVGRALASAQSQTYDSLEIVITDNASNDRTWEIVTAHAAADSRIRCLRNANNVGPLKNWQIGLAQCKGIYVKILWSDDWLEPPFIAECVAALEADSGAGFVFSAAIIHESHRDWAKLLHPDRSSFTLADYLARTNLDKNMPVSPGCALARRIDSEFELLPGSNAELERIGINIGAGPDLLFLLRAALKYPRVAHIPKFYCHFDYVDQSLTRQHTADVITAYRETLDLFLQTIGPKFPSVVRHVKRARLEHALINLCLWPLRKIRNAVRAVLRAS